MYCILCRSWGSPPLDPLLLQKLGVSTPLDPPFLEKVHVFTRLLGSLDYSRDTHWWWDFPAFFPARRRPNSVVFLPVFEYFALRPPAYLWSRGFRGCDQHSVGLWRTPRTLYHIAWLIDLVGAGTWPASDAPLVKGPPGPDAGIPALNAAHSKTNPICGPVSVALSTPRWKTFGSWWIQHWLGLTFHPWYPRTEKLNNSIFERVQSFFSK